ncbi:MAG: ATP synthase epsilon chain [Candidatus Kuenenbacteria bacterium GW2011_GWA2_42_15]|uniref:ATP synthase epsilon chain n=1 Tax=Candidatus Kuenenbacteria bacterium GW2011_GWA2_42_15 TaxID=1618677 RepID=A0A0G1B4A4_9BACT|nr:MAG: ATP synthase epsilon chain [Candidatus Kuenenbacteria bacterium GW2011_GWA2_42_15]
MDNKKIHFEITTPEKNVYRDEVDSISLPTEMGQITVLVNHVVVLADTAEHAAEIDEQRAEEARKRAEELLKEKMGDAKEYAAVAAKLQRELARLKVARKHRNRKGIKID